MSFTIYVPDRSGHVVWAALKEKIMRGKYAENIDDVWVYFKADQVDVFRDQTGEIAGWMQKTGDKETMFAMYFQAFDDRCLDCMVAELKKSRCVYIESSDRDDSFWAAAGFVIVRGVPPHWDRPVFCIKLNLDMCYLLTALFVTMNLLNSYDVNFLQWFLGEVADYARPNNAAKQVAIMRLVCRKWREALWTLALYLYDITSPLRTKHLSRCDVGKILEGIRNRSTPRGRFPIIENPIRCEERIPCETLTRGMESVTFTEKYFLADYYISPYKQRHKIWYVSDDADALFFIETTGNGGLIWKAKYWRIKRSRGESLVRLFREGNALKLIEKTASCKKQLYIERHYIRGYLHTVKWSKDAIFHEIDDCDENEPPRFFRIDETGVHQV